MKHVCEVFISDNYYQLDKDKLNDLDDIKNLYSSSELDIQIALKKRLLEIHHSNIEEGENSDEEEEGEEESE